MKYAAPCICFLLAVSLHSQERLTNETIIKLTKAGIGEDVIVGMVNQQPGNYSLSADIMIALKKAGVSDKVMAAMVVKNGGTDIQPAPAAAARLKSSSDAVPAPSVPNDAPPLSSSSSLTARAHVYITDIRSWEIRGEWAAAAGNSNPDGGNYQSPGARLQAAEVIKAFNQQCPRISVTNTIEKADFAIAFDHEGGIGILHRHKIVVFNRDGDDIFSDSTMQLTNSMKDACEAILSHRRWTGHLPTTALPVGVTKIFTNPSVFDVTFISTPPNASVTISGQPIGRTPFTTPLPPGIYKAVVSANGYAPVSKEVTVGVGYPTTVSTSLPAEQ